MYTYSEELYSDYHKAAYGSRPSLESWNSKTPDEKQAEWDYLDEMIEQNQRQEEEYEKMCLANWNESLMIAISAGAGDRETAIRWLTQTREFHHEQDVEAWVYELGILFTVTGRELVEEVNELVKDQFTW